MQMNLINTSKEACRNIFTKFNYDIWNFIDHSLSTRDKHKKVEIDTNLMIDKGSMENNK